ncbi:hypothetical protein MOQ_004913 [Trypanosoma cruzi marinkellei]|uniref:Uncharacterized protein n=1 Tax=Trypanosoma cruzi marinkellei TaxID=85056 RepID=K2N8X6_TRYCR|nr:hypothetical protein MOQ_004913 [Trypanosoma cruzi marinkellei]
MNTPTNLGDLVIATPSSLAAGKSCAAEVGTTVTSRNRALVAQHKKETAKATVKEVDVLHRGLKRLETRMHELESRVQYVNPWVVQYMWELLCELRDRIGMNYSHRREKAWITGLLHRRQNSRGDQPLTEPGMKGSLKRGPSEARTGTAGSRDETLLTTPIHLFEYSNEVVEGEHQEDDDNIFETSLSDESDDGRLPFRENGVVTTETCAQGGADFVQSSPSIDESKRLKVGTIPKTNGRRLARYMATLGARWEDYRITQEESTSRLEIALEESTQRSLLISSLSCTLATVLHQREAVLASSASSNGGNVHGMHRNATQRHGGIATQRRRERFDDLDVPSPPRTEIPAGLSPIQLVQSPSDFFSPERGNGGRGGNQERSRRAERSATDVVDDDSDFFSPNNRRKKNRREHEMTALVCSVLEAPEFMGRVVNEVSRQLAVQIQQADTSGEEHLSSSESLPSALLLTAREAVNAIAGARDEALYHQLKEYLAHEQRQRTAKEESLWQRVTEYEELWERRTAAERQTKAEVLQEHQRLLALGREDAESCSEIRRELLKLCGEVVRAVEGMPDSFAAPRSGMELDDRQPNGTEAIRDEKMLLRLETLSAAVSSLYSDLESLRKRSKGELAPQSEWCKQTESHIATLQESMVDVQEAVSIMARKSRAAEERIDASKAEKEELIKWTERIQGLEQQVEALPSIFSTAMSPPLPPPIETTATTGVEMNLMSVEDAMMCVQRNILSRCANLATSTDPYFRALSALCATLQKLSHLYNVGTGTFGVSLRLIFAMPPLSVPSSLASACQAYLREHSAAELKEAMEALNVTQQVAKVLYDSYYWMQSHILVVDDKAIEASLQNMEDSTVLAEGGNSAERTEPLPKFNIVSSFCKGQPRSATTDGKCKMEALTRSKEASLLQEPKLSSSNLTATQREPSETAIPLPSSQHNTRPESNSAESDENNQQERQTGELTSPTPLESLAMASPLKTMDAYCGVMHHYHHHFNCSREEGHNFTPQFPREKETERKFSPKPHVSQCSETQWDARETRWGNTAQHIGALYNDGSNFAEQTTPLPVSSLNRSHIDVEKGIGRMGERMTQNGYTSLDLPPTPSVVNECLTLPTAVSSFVDPQQVTHTSGRGSLPLKDLQPFYTAVTRPRPNSHSNFDKNNSDGSARERATLFVSRLGGDAGEKGIRHSLHRHQNLHSNLQKKC